MVNAILQALEMLPTSMVRNNEGSEAEDGEDKGETLVE